MPASGTRNLAAQQALISACDCRFDLVMSVFVTEDRWDPDPKYHGLHHRFSRFEVFLYTLRSYAPLPLERVYLYVELDKQFEARRAELRAAAHQLFGSRLMTLQPRRLVTQAAWRDEMAATIAPRDRARPDDSDTRLIWFLQNDDHVFIDVNADVLCEGLARCVPSWGPAVERRRGEAPWRGAVERRRGGAPWGRAVGSRCDLPRPRLPIARAVRWALAR